VYFTFLHRNIFYFHLLLFIWIEESHFTKINLPLYDLLVDFGCTGKGKVTVLATLLQG
jgi:hypothetical protein